MSDFSRFLEIRRVYGNVLPKWMAEYQETGNMHHDPYFFDLAMVFTPIEAAVWSEIRYAGIPFYPQIPALNYFIDFGCPFLKIGIECDGKAWHDYELDKARDARLAAEGWTIFRIEGRQCLHTTDDPWDDRLRSMDAMQIHKWFASAAGVIYAIKQRYFADRSDRFATENRFLIDSTLFNHCSTPGVQTPQRLSRKKSFGPVLARDYMGVFLERLLRSVEAASA